MKNIIKVAAIVLFIVGLTASAQAQRVNRYSVMLGAQSTKVAAGGFLDLKTGEVRTLKEATLKRGTIDWLYVHASKSGANLMVPAARGLRGFSRYNKAVVQGWDTKNSGRFVLLGKDKKHRRTFRRAKTNEQLEKAYTEAATEVKKREDYKVSKYGPSARLRNIEVGDYIVYRSRTKGRDVYAIARVTNIRTGLRGSISLDVKSTK